MAILLRGLKYITLSRFFIQLPLNHTTLIMTSLERFSILLILQVPVRNVQKFQLGSRPTILTKMFILFLSHSLKILGQHGSCQPTKTLIQEGTQERSGVFAVGPGEELSVWALQHEL